MQRLLIDLDCLLDTRLAAISTVSSDVAQMMVGIPQLMDKYRKRNTDDFSQFGIDMEKYNEVWKNRKASILRASMMTPLAHFLVDIVEQVHQEAILKPHEYRGGFEIHINTYPYVDLSRVEIDALLDAISSRLKRRVPIYSVCLSDEELTPFLIREREYNCIFFYNFVYWLSTQFPNTLSDEEALDRCIPGVTVYSSYQIANMDDMKDAFEFKNPQGEQCPPHIGAQIALKPVINLEFINIDYYCIIDLDLHVNLTVELSKI